MYVYISISSRNLSFLWFKFNKNSYSYIDIILLYSQMKTGVQIILPCFPWTFVGKMGLIVSFLTKTSSCSRCRNVNDKWRFIFFIFIAHEPSSFYKQGYILNYIIILQCNYYSSIILYIYIYYLLGIYTMKNGNWTRSSTFFALVT